MANKARKNKKTVVKTPMQKLLKVVKVGVRGKE